MGKSFKRIQHRQRIAARLAEQEIVLEQVVEVKPESKAVPAKVPQKVEPEVVEVDDEDEEISSEDLAKSVLQTQAKKGAPKKK